MTDKNKNNHPGDPDGSFDAPEGETQFDPVAEARAARLERFGLCHDPEMDVWYAVPLSLVAKWISLYDASCWSGAADEVAGDEFNRLFEKYIVNLDNLSFCDPDEGEEW